MENILYFSIVAGLLLLGFLGFVSGDYITQFEADIYAVPQFTPNVSIQVPDYVYIGNVTAGDKQDDEIKIYFNNTGNVDIQITPRLQNSSESIFSYLYFTKRLSGNDFIWKRIGNFSITIAAPTSGGYRADYIYAKLDLTNYTGDLTGDLIAHKVNIVYDVVAS